MKLLADSVRWCYDRSPGFRTFFWKQWYEILGGRKSVRGVSFLNYGYSSLDNGGKDLALSEAEESNRVCIQLYHHVAQDCLSKLVSFSDTHMLEVGSGRGGGAEFLARTLKPKSYTGVDFSKSNISYCKDTHALPNLHFQVGNAEELPLEENSVDIVVNVESSHCYGSFERFVSEVERVLKPGGYFAFADLRDSCDLEKLEQQFGATALKSVHFELITAEVVKALEEDNERRCGLVESLLPSYMHSTVKEFAGTIDSPIYNDFKNRNVEYVHYVLQK